MYFIIIQIVINFSRKMLCEKDSCFKKHCVLSFLQFLGLSHAIPKVRVQNTSSNKNNKVSDGTKTKNLFSP